MNVRTIRFDNTTSVLSLVRKAQTWVLLPVNEGSKHWVGGHRGEGAIDNSGRAVCKAIMNVRVIEMEKKGVITARENRPAQEGIRRTEESPIINLTQEN